MVKPLERNTRYVDAVLTIPKGTLYPMCGMNMAFDRALIGPAMYFGLMGEGQPIGRYDDMWAGWCSKVRLIGGSTDGTMFDATTAYRCLQMGWILLGTFMAQQQQKRRYKQALLVVAGAVQVYASPMSQYLYGGNADA